MNTPIPPTIPSDNQFTTNSTRLQKITDLLEATSINVPTVAGGSIYSVLEGGTMSNINDPVDNQDAATLAYVLANSGGGIPEGPQYSVQYNDSGVFGGSSDLLYNNLTNTLTAKMITNGTVDIGNGTINNLAIPTVGNQAATKAYAQVGFTITKTVDNTVGTIQYTATEMVNGIIERNITGGGTITDTVDTAANIITETGIVIGGSFNFIIKNTSTDFDSIIRIDATSMGTGVTLVGAPANIYPGYQYTALIKITSSTTVDILVLNCNRTLINDNFNYRFQKSFGNINILQCTDYYCEWVDPSTLEVTQYSTGVYGRYISPLTTISKKVITTEVCTGTSANSTDTTNNRIVLAGGSLWYDYIINGGFDFYIANPLASTQSVIFDNTKTDFGNYTIDTVNNVYSISPGQTGWFLVTWNADTGVGALYSLGFFDTVA